MTSHHLRKYINILAEKREHKNEAEAFLITCLDHRMVDFEINFMEKKSHMKGEFDTFVMAGAELGILKHKNWAQCFWEHLELAIELHKIKSVYILSHRDCGAYKLEYGELDGDEELKIHSDNLEEVEELIKAKYPNLEVRKVLMDLDGDFEIIKCEKEK